MTRKITALKVQKKNPDRINVYLDGEFSFGLSRIVAAWLSIGQEINQAKIDELLAKDEIEVAYQRSLRFISYRPRSSYEVEQKLEKLDFPESVIEIVIDRLNHQFAELWVENRSEFRPRSHRVLRWELKQKKISEDIIQDVLLNADAELALAETAARKYARRLRDQEFDVFKKRLTGFLARRGFSYQITNEIVNMMWEETKRENGNEVLI